jgi:hypothetical protein
MSYDSSTGVFTAWITGAKVGDTLELAWPEIVGRATLRSSCVELGAPKDASSGSLTLRLLSSGCHFSVEAKSAR